MCQRYRWLALVAAGLFVLALSPAAGAQGRCQIPGKTEIVFGGSLALTGPLSDDGKWIKNMYDLWVDDVNASGGILGCKVRLILYDDKTDPASVVGLYEKLIAADKVDMIFSPYASGLVLPAMSLAAKYQKVFVSGGACATPVFTKGNPFLFSTMAGADVMHGYSTFKGLKAALSADKFPKTMGIVYAENVFTIGTAKGLRAYAKEYGVKVLVDESYSLKAVDFTPAVTKLKTANVDMVFIAGWLRETVSIVRTMNEIGFKPKAIWSSAGGTHTNTAKLLGPLAEGLMSDSHWEPTYPYAGAEEFARKYKARFGEDVYDYPAVMYAALQVQRAAIEATKSVDQGKLLEYIRTHSFDTIVGPQQFLPTGMPTNFTFVSTQIQGGKRMIWYPEKDVVFGRPIKNAGLRYPGRPN